MQEESKTSLQKIREALIRRFGQNSIRLEADIPSNLEQEDGASTETPEQRRLRLGKGPMEPIEQELIGGRMHGRDMEERRQRRQRSTILE